MVDYIMEVPESPSVISGAPNLEKFTSIGRHIAQCFLHNRSWSKQNIAGGRGDHDFATSLRRLRTSVQKKKR